VAADCVPPILPVPLGTANLMGRHLGIHWNRSNVEAQVMGAIEQHQTISIDAAKANDRLFLLMSGVGFDAFIVHELDRLRKRRRGWFIAKGPASASNHPARSRSRSTATPRATPPSRSTCFRFGCHLLSRDVRGPLSVVRCRKQQLTTDN